ncbi:Sec63 Brl domain-containing protein [Lipomyces arxii]|uniref:Sec63 Brl domain-containing protein n=1 Tax=Lipomyces arxii TaxID=56418 RepID=UPI0034CE384C
MIRSNTEAITSNVLRQQESISVTSLPKCISTTVLPDRFRALFTFSEFNRMQSICFPTLFQKDENVVVSSPTGSGKTLLFEIAIFRALLSNSTGNFKVIYIAPTKALSYERYQDWSVRFTIIGLKCGLLTGDTPLEELEIVKKSDIIITTPEKWDSTTRRWNDYDRLMKLVKLVLIDEVHILKDTRGATLETLVSRMKYISPHSRFVALSATIPNSNDIAEWLGKSQNSRSAPAHLFTFGNEFRPVKLDVRVCGYHTQATNPFHIDKMYTRKLLEVLDMYFHGRPAIVFCPTRKITISTARYLAQKWRSLQRFAPPVQLSDIRLQEKELGDLMIAGIAYHHAGLSLPDRSAVEKAFTDKQILVICCTSTLSVGVNLPAHLVVVKGTAAWIDGRTQEYTEFDLQQMVGRAGRPQFDTSGIAVVMTTESNRDRYEFLSSSEELVESCLHNNLVEHINAEICLRTITDFKSAKDWLRSTFLYVRIQKNPTHYKIAGPSPMRSIEDFLDRLCTETVILLSESKIIEQSNNSELHSTPFGKCMALFYIQFETMKVFMESPERMSMSAILDLLSRAGEFKDIRFKAGEKKFFKEINAGFNVRFAFKPSEISECHHKVNLIIQFILAHGEFPVYEGSGKHAAQLQSDKSIIWQHIHRLMKCIIECKLQAKDGVSLRAAFELSRSIEAEIWEHSSNMLLQLDGIGPATVRKFVNSNVKTFADLANLDCIEIEQILSVNRARGIKFLQELEKIPKFSVSLKKVSEAHDGAKVKIGLSVNVTATNKSIVRLHRRKLLTVAFLVELSTGELLDFRRSVMYQLKPSRQYIVYAVLQNWPIQPLMARCTVACEELVGTDAVNEIEVALQLEHKELLQSKSQVKIAELGKVQKQLLGLESIESISSDDLLCEQDFDQCDLPPSRFNKWSLGLCGNLLTI